VCETVGLVTVFLVRHARAGRRDRWVGDDRLRPLSKKGRAQAGALPGLLLPLISETLVSDPPITDTPVTDTPIADTPIVDTPIVDTRVGAAPVRLLASPWVRCTQTLEPLAAALGVVVELDDALSEGMGEKTVEALAAWLRDGTTVLCTHGDVVEAVLAHVERGGVRLRPKGMPPKGSVWCFTGVDAVAAAQYFPPPA
jgi:phosphohistidine phosphatase SixA